MRLVTARASAAASPATKRLTTSLVTGAVVMSWRTRSLAEAASSTRRSNAVHLHEAPTEEAGLPAGTGYSCPQSSLRDPVWPGLNVRRAVLQTPLPPWLQAAPPAHGDL